MVYLPASPSNSDTVTLYIGGTQKMLVGKKMLVDKKIEVFIFFLLNIRDHFILIGIQPKNLPRNMGLLII